MFFFNAKFCFVQDIDLLDTYDCKTTALYSKYLFHGIVEPWRITILNFFYRETIKLSAIILSLKNDIYLIVPVWFKTFFLHPK